MVPSGRSVRAAAACAFWRGTGADQALPVSFSVSGESVPGRDVRHFPHWNAVLEFSVAQTGHSIARAEPTSAVASNYDLNGVENKGSSRSQMRFFGDSRDQSIERAPFDQLHGKRVDTVAFFHRIQRHDIWMIECRDRASFALKAREALRIAGHIRRQDLKGHCAAEVGIRGGTPLPSRLHRWRRRSDNARACGRPDQASQLASSE